MKQGLVLDKVVLLGRTLEEYRQFFALDLDLLKGASVLDVASGVSSFCAEANQLGIRVTAVDPIYELAPEAIEPRCGTDLAHVAGAIGNHKTYRWDFYKTPANQRGFRERAYRAFLEDFKARPDGRYVAGILPHLPFGDRQFDLTLVSYLMFVYEDLFDYDFHRRAVLEIMRVTRGEARFYPTVSFEAVRSPYIDQFTQDESLRHLIFEEVRTDFEFLLNSNFFLRVIHR